MWALRRDDRAHAYLALGLTLLLGVAFINSTVYLYQQLGAAAHRLGHRRRCSTSSPAPTSSWSSSGSCSSWSWAFQALGGQLTGRDAEGMTAAALYWYVTVAVYTVIYYGIYITK